MVSTMPAYNTANRIYRLLLLALVFMPTATFAESFSVQSAEITKIGNGYALDAQLNYPLTARVEEAIDNGVPITFLQQMELIHSLPLLGKYWQWQQTLWQSELRYQLRYHALTRQYVLLSLDTREHRNFPSLTSALDALGQVNNFSLPPEYLTDTDGLILQLRTSLDLYALPTPMRPGALISSKWDLTSPWVAATWH
ncbi:hypothetical protein A9Q78_10380 [Methylophaga sp. 41_12_T18]|nr:hypothetical protein A9Q78_10380 [Methylophaga sp. 41_12_T18]